VSALLERYLRSSALPGGSPGVGTLQAESAVLGAGWPTRLSDVPEASEPGPGVDWVVSRP
jgi:hypothetical protein